MGRTAIAAVAALMTASACGGSGPRRTPVAANTTSTSTDQTNTSEPPTSDTQATGGSVPNGLSTSTTPAKPGGGTTVTAAGSLVHEVTPARARAASTGAQGARPAGAAVASFGGRLYQALASSTDRNANISFSPLSISTVFAMLTPGAKGSTADELIKVFGVSASDADQQAFNSLLQELQARNRDGSEGPGKVMLRQANDLWSQDGLTLQPDFLNRLGLSYGAGMHLVDFRSPAAQAQAVQRINSSVSTTTNGRIPRLLDASQVTFQTRLVLVNALYLLASWSVPFEAGRTQPGPFTHRDGTVAQVPFMHDDRGAYASGDGWQAVTLPMSGGQLAMVLVLPDQARFDGVEQSMGPTLLTAAATPASPRPLVHLSLPKFTVTTGAELTPILKSLGVRQAFTDAADFSGIAAAPPLKLQFVVHKTFLAVNESGVEAAAATAAGMEATSAVDTPRVVDLDFNRPFLFAIVDQPTGAPLFMGRVMDPPQ